MAKNEKRIAPPKGITQKYPQSKPPYNSSDGKYVGLGPKKKVDPPYLPALTVIAEADEYLQCQDSNGFTFYVAKPYLLRKSPFDGFSANGVSYSYTDVGRRDASKVGEETEDQAITPSYYAGEKILVAINHPTKINGRPMKGADGQNISYTDLDDAGRTWAAIIGTYLRSSADLSDIANTFTARANLGLIINIDVQAYSPLLFSIATLGDPGADALMFWNDTSNATEWAGFGTNISVTANTINVANSNWDDAYTHVSNDGSDHSYIDQDVTIGSGPAFTSAVLTTPVLGIPTSGTLTNCTQAEWDAAYSHISATGASHSYIDQSVVSGATPTFTATNITGVPSASVLAGTFGTGAYVFDNTVSGITTLTATTLTDSTWSTVAGVHTGIVSLDGAGTIDLENNLDGTGFIITAGEVDIIHTATEADNHSLEILSDAAGFGDVKAIEIDYITGAIVAGIDEGVILINIDETLATGGEVFGLEILATDGSATITGLKLGPLVNPIHQDSGVFVNPTTGTDNTPSTDIPAMIDGSTGTATTIFEADNEYIIIGSAAAFQDIEFILTAGANVSIKPTFWYSTAGTHQFTQFTPVDGTDGFKHTGVVSWDASDLTGHVADGVTGTFDIKIIRTRNNLTTDPTLGYAKIAATTEYTWDESGDVSIRDLTISGTFTDGTMSIVGGAISSATNTNWDTAYGWGDHGSAGYIKADGTIPLTSNWDVGNFDLTMKNLTCDGTITDGTATLTGGALSGIESIVIADGGTIGQAAGPLLTFNDTNNRLGITGCKVGINELAPQKLFHLTGVDTGAMNFNASANLVIEDTGTSWLYFMSDVEGIAGIAFGDTADTFKASIDYNHDGDYLRIYSNSAERMRIDNAGQLGIGTPTPEDLLHLYKGSAGGGTADANTSMIIEDDNHAFLEIRTPNNKTGGILMSDQDGSARGQFKYDHNADLFRIATAGNFDILYNGGAFPVMFRTNTSVSVEIVSGKLLLANGVPLEMQEAFNMVGATGENIINIPANLADALSIVNLAVGDLLVFDTRTGAVNITIGASVTLTNGTASLLAGALTGLTAVNSVTATELSQLETMGAVTISAAQWGYLGATGAGGGQLLAALTTGESTQLEAIGATTISAAQWAYLGGMDQALAQASSVTFAALNLISDTAYGVGWNGDTTGAASKNALYDIISTLSGDVSAGAIMTDHAIVRGDGGAKGVQDTGITIDDSDNIAGVNGLGFTAPSTIRINSAGAITVVQTLHKIDTYGLTATDNLDDIVADDGSLIVFSSVSAARVITIRDGVGNLHMASNFILNDIESVITFVMVGGEAIEISRSDNA